MGRLRGALVVVAAAVVLGGCGVAALEATSSQPAYRLGALEVRARFPGAPARLQVGDGAARERTWRLVRDGASYTLSLVTGRGRRPSPTTLADLQLRLAQHRGRPPEGSIAFAPASRRCGPRQRRLERSGHSAWEYFQVERQGEGVAGPTCDGMLRLGVRHGVVLASVVAEPAAARAFLRSVVVVGTSPGPRRLGPGAATGRRVRA